MITASFVCALLAGLYFGLGVHPYRFIIYIAYSLLFPSFNIILIWFSVRNDSWVVTTSFEEDHHAHADIGGAHKSSTAKPAAAGGGDRHSQGTNYGSEFVISSIAPIQN